MAELHKPFGDIYPLSGFRPGRDYRKDEAWTSLGEKSKALVALAKKWIETQPFAGQGANVDGDCQEPFYRAVVQATGISLHKETGYHDYINLFAEMQTLPSLLSSENLKIPAGSKLHAVREELRTTEARSMLEIRNAALQEARAELDRGQFLGR